MGKKGKRRERKRKERKRKETENFLNLEIKIKDNLWT
jgi:hypothetical protein